MEEKEIESASKANFLKSTDLIFQTQIIQPNRFNSLKYQKSTILGFKDLWIRKSEFLTKTQFLYN